MARPSRIPKIAGVLTPRIKTLFQTCRLKRHFNTRPGVQNTQMLTQKHRCTKRCFIGGRPEAKPPEKPGRRSRADKSITPKQLPVGSSPKMAGCRATKPPRPGYQAASAGCRAGLGNHAIISTAAPRSATMLQPPEQPCSASGHLASSSNTCHMD